MVDGDREVEERNKEALEELAWTLSGNRGEFALVMARCDSARFRNDLLGRLRENFKLDPTEIAVDNGVQALFALIKSQTEGRTVEAAMVTGLEMVRQPDSLLSALNQVREEFRKHFRFPVVIWVTGEMQQRLLKVAGDFYSWSVPVAFRVPNEILINTIRDAGARALSFFLGSGEISWSQETAEYIPGTNNHLRVDLQLAKRVLDERGVPLETSLEAGLEFVLARETDFSTPPCRLHFERSLNLWRQTKRKAETAATLFHLGLGWMLHGMRTPPARDRSYAVAVKYMKECVETFELAHFPDLASRSRIIYCGALMRHGDWEAFEEAMIPVRSYVESIGDTAMLARLEGFEAELAIHYKDYERASQLAESALDKVDDLEDQVAWSVARGSWSEDMLSYHRAWYLYSLARARHGLGGNNSYVELLMEAGRELSSGLDPDLYSRLLGELQRGFFEMKLYGKAFHYYQEHKTLEQKIGCRAFMGPGRLKPAQVVSGISTGLDLRMKDEVAFEVKHTRMDQVDEIKCRISASDEALILLHGPSGTGKSSLVLAGFMPEVVGKAIGYRDVVFYYLDYYRNWEEDLSKLVIGKQGTRAAILESFQKGSENMQFTILVLDQFEEYFCSSAGQDKELLRFITACMDIPFVKLIVAVRDEFLEQWEESFAGEMHYTEEQGMALGAFTRDNAVNLVSRLSKRSALEWEDGLLEMMVDDLAGEDGLVNPLELQIAGARMQAEDIIRKDDYPGKLPLIQHWLKYTISLCGPENATLVYTLLYLLTKRESEVSARELEDELSKRFQPWEREQRTTFEMVLTILQKSGILDLYPAFPTNGYRLAYASLGDYIVDKMHRIEEASPTASE